MKRRLKVGVIGCGGIGQMMHLPFLSELNEVYEIFALADIEEDVVKELGRRYNVKRIYRDYNELLKEPLDCVFILSGDSHYKPVIASLNANKHIFCEKPLGENLREVEEITHHWTGLKPAPTLMVAYHKRYDPCFSYAKSKIGELKDLRYVQVNVLHPVDARYRDHYPIYPPLLSDKKIAQDNEEKDGLKEYVIRGSASSRVNEIVGDSAPLEQKVGTFLLFNSLIHDINFLRGLLGEPEDVLSTYFWKEGRCINVNLKYRKNLHCVLSWIYLAGVKNYKEELLFLSPEKRVKITFPSPYLKNFPTPISIEEMEDEVLIEKKITLSYEEAFKNEILHFYECVCNGRTPDTDIKDALNDTILLEKISRAYRNEYSS